MPLEAGDIQQIGTMFKQMMDDQKKADADAAHETEQNKILSKVATRRFVAIVALVTILFGVPVNLGARKIFSEAMPAGGQGATIQNGADQEDGKNIERLKQLRDNKNQVKKGE